MSESDPKRLIQTLAAAGSELPEDLRARIVELGPRATPFLIRLLKDPSLRSPQSPGEGYGPIHAAGLLGEIESPEATSALLSALEEGGDDDLLLDGCVLALAKVGHANLVLAAYAQASNLDHRRCLIDVLSHLDSRDERIYQALCGWLEEEPEFAASCLATYGDSRALPLLIELLERTPHPGQVVWDAHLLLTELGGAIEALGGELSAEDLEKSRQFVGLPLERMRWEVVDGPGFYWTRRLLSFEGEVDHEALRTFETALRERFLQSPEGAEIQRSGGRAGAWVQVMTNLCVKHCGLDPCDFDPEHLDEILLYVVPKQVACRPEDAPEVIAELGAFWRFAAREFGVSDLIGYERVLRKAKRALPQVLGDARLWSHSKTLVMHGERAGFDMRTPEGVEAYQAVWNREQATRQRARESDAAAAAKKKSKAKKDKRKREKAKRKRRR